MLILILAALILIVFPSISDGFKTVGASMPSFDHRASGCDDKSGGHWKEGAKVASISNAKFVTIFRCESHSWTKDARYENVVSVPRVGSLKHTCSADIRNYENGGLITKSYNSGDKVGKQTESRDGQIVVEIYKCKFKHDVTNWAMEETVPTASIQVREEM
jgi:hypothetical protein